MSSLLIYNNLKAKLKVKYLVDVSKDHIYVALCAFWNGRRIIGHFIIDESFNNPMKIGKRKEIIRKTKETLLNWYNATVLNYDDLSAYQKRRLKAKGATLYFIDKSVVCKAMEMRRVRGKYLGNKTEVNWHKLILIELKTGKE